MKKKKIDILICSLFLTGLCIDYAIAYDNYNVTTYIDDFEIIKEYTWSVMRYDHVSDSQNFDFVEMPKPSPGTIIIPTNMISFEVCHAAISLFDENKMNILKSLEEYDLGNMDVGLPFIMWSIFANRNSLPVYKQKASAIEMSLFADKIFHADYVGDCYSQSLFNTAVLRLCGFSPEEVFTLVIPMHAIAIVKVDEIWYAFDSVMAQFSRQAIMEKYPGTIDMIYWMENDKYFVNFGTPFPEAYPYMDTPYSNIDPTILISIVDQVVPLLNGSSLGAQDWDILDFIENAIPSPDIAAIACPNNVRDSMGSTVEEKAWSLVKLNKDFVYNQTGNDAPNQYDRSLYSLGVLSLEYPQSYANAARYGSWTSWFGTKLDSKTPGKDIQRTANWINFFIETSQILNENYIHFSDFTYRVRKGSTLDKALVAYGTLRNMKKDNDFWQPQELFVLVTEDNNGYLAVNTTKGWEYINFGIGKSIENSPPAQIEIFFNEIECFYSWDS